MCAWWVVRGAPKKMRTRKRAGMVRVIVRRRERKAGCLAVCVSGCVSCEVRVWAWDVRLL